MDNYTKAVSVLFALVLPQLLYAEPYADGIVPEGGSWTVTWAPVDGKFQRIKVLGGNPRCLSPCWRSSEYTSYGSEAVQFSTVGQQPVVVWLGSGAKFRKASQEIQIKIYRPKN